MYKLTISVEKFNSVNMLDIINTNNIYDEVENSICSITSYTLKKLRNFSKGKKLSEDQKIDFFLKKSLLSIFSSNTPWIQYSSKYDLSEDYLYILLKKYYMKHTNKFS